MSPRILLVNPPIYDFTAYDFWLKPYGLLTVAGYLRGRAEFLFFDYLDRLHPSLAGDKRFAGDKFGRGRFYDDRIESPLPLKDIPRYYRRFGLPRRYFQEFLKENVPCDFAFIQTTMTYWYPGYAEAIEDIRKYWPQTVIVLGGNYVCICTEHAKTLGADLLIDTVNPALLFEELNIEGDLNQPALWEVYDRLQVGVTRLSDGCPFSCSYCSVPVTYGKFSIRPKTRALAEVEQLSKRAVRDIAFYDDALLCNAQTVMVPFLQEVIERKIDVCFHSPNALNARFIDKDLAELMVRAGFKTFYLGFESMSRQWQRRTGSKVFSDELAAAVECLSAAGACKSNITAYQILGHPDIDTQQFEESMLFVNSLGIRGMPADFSPVPGTSDGELCRKWIDLDEPLMHNKTAFPIILLGFDEVNRLKDIQKKLNRALL